MGDLVSLSKRRGFIFQSSEIYGGAPACWDYGPLGAQLKRNIAENWWKAMTYREDIEGLDTSVLMHPTVWKASGHVEGFNDPMVDCRKCKGRFRADHLQGENCPSCGAVNSFTEARDFNLMFKTQMGPIPSEEATVYLRPETAQGIFVDFALVQGCMRKKIPFGVAQIGKAFRNEISPGNFIFRMREFEQMEMQYFVKPGTEVEAMEQWQERRYQWHLANGLSKGKLDQRPHGKDELAHYARTAVDIEYKFPHGTGELEGIHSRSDFDLARHQKYSGKKLEFVDQADGNKRYLPFVVETSVGLDRCLLALLCDAYRTENKGDRERERVVLGLMPHLSPVKLAVLPLMRKVDIEEPCRKFFEDIGKHYRAEYDSAGSIGKRYRRQDEIGTPFCFTYDFDTLEDGAVTVRERDTMAQERIPLEQVANYLRDRFLR